MAMVSSDAVGCGLAISGCAEEFEAESQNCHSGL